MSESQIDRYGVMGYPVAHSRSPVIHKLFAAQTGQNIRYDLLPVKPQELESAIAQFRRKGGKGFNVTVPHKNDVAMLVDEMSERAQIAGAVNTVVVRDDSMYGDNTDGCGLIRDFLDNLELEIESAGILVLGAGGATRGIIAPLLDQKPESVLIANRTLPKAEALVGHFSSFGPVIACRFDNVPERHFDIVINATSAGLRGETPPYPVAAVGPDTVCYDLSYGLTPTPFSEWASHQGAARSIMGWGMLVEQAAESFELWRGVRPDTKPVLKRMTISA